MKSKKWYSKADFDKKCQNQSKICDEKYHAMRLTDLKERLEQSDLVTIAVLATASKAM